MVSLQAKVVYTFMNLIGLRKRILNKDNLQQERNNFLKEGVEKLLITRTNTKITKSEIDGVSVEIITPKTEMTKKIVLYLHGGGFVFDQVPTHKAFMSKIAEKAQVKVIAVRYKLAPEFTFPSQIEEITKVFQWLLKQGHKSTDIYIIGDSAGANLAITTTLFLRDKHIDLPAGLILISPPTDATLSGKSYTTNKNLDVMLSYENMQFFVDAYRGNQSPKNPLISPIFANLKGLPIIQVFVSNNEILLDDTSELIKKLKQEKVSHEVHIGKELWHAYPLFDRLVPEAKNALNEIISFIHSSN